MHAAPWILLRLDIREDEVKMAAGLDNRKSKGFPIADCSITGVSGQLPTPVFCFELVIALWSKTKMIGFRGEGEKK